MPFKSNHIIIFVAALAVGFLLVAQFFSAEKTKEIASDEMRESLVLEVSILADSNKKLRGEVGKLEDQQRDYDDVLAYKENSEEVLTSTLSKYQKNSGLFEYEGEGIEVKLTGPVLDVNLLDMLNTFKNIGIVGSSLNGKRIVYKSSIRPEGLSILLDGAVISEPYVFLACGNRDLLYEGVKREGGIIEQIETTFPNIKIEVNKKERVKLPAYQGPLAFDIAEVNSD